MHDWGVLHRLLDPGDQRPKYWGKLVMELVYDYLDKDVADWLRDNAPKPRHGQNYHQWLSGQYGLKRLTEHLWMLIGMAAACQTMSELKQKMAERFGRQQVQFTLFMTPPTATRAIAARAASIDSNEALAKLWPVVQEVRTNGRLGGMGPLEKRVEEIIEGATMAAEPALGAVKGLRDLNMEITPLQEIALLQGNVSGLQEAMKMLAREIQTLRDL